MSKTRWVLLLAVALVFAAAVAVGIARVRGSEQAQQAWPPTPCVVQGIDARCGTFVVPEDRAKPDGRTIGLNVVVLPAWSKPVSKNAFAFLAGGPGSAATEEAASLSQLWVSSNATHDILLVDQRGTGQSNAYTCPDPTKPLVSRADLRSYALACLKAFGGDVSQYGTRAAMDDLDAVRAALGYRQLDVFGASYGATAAQVYLKLHPASVHTLMLSGPTAMDVPFFGRYAVNAQHALDQVARRCASEPACRKAFPNWEQQFGSLVRAWNAHPVEIRKGVTMTGDMFAGVVHELLLDMEKAAFIPLVVASAAKGDYTPIEGEGDLGAPAPQLMSWSVWCNEPWAGLGAEPPWGTSFDSYTAAKIANYRRGCTFLPKRSEPRSLWTLPSGSRVPVLAFAGGADPQDPPANLADLKRHFPDSRVVVLPNLGHQFGVGGCIDEIAADFVRAGTTRRLDSTRCDGEIFVPSFALTP